MDLFQNITDYEILTPDGFKDFDGIKLSKNIVYEIKTNNNILNCTKDHLLYCSNKNKFVKVIKLNVGDEIKSKDDSNEKIISIKKIDKEKIVADIVNVKDCKCYYTNNILSHNCLFIDEIAFIQHNIFHTFYNSVYPTISKSKDSKIIMVSTANSMNHFYKLWEDAKKDLNGFKPFEVKWNDVPGRDAEWKRRTISQIGQFAWLQEFENSFLGSMNTLISTEAIKNLTFKKPVKYMLDNNMVIYDEPKEKRLYVVSGDTSKGVGKDYSCSQVIDVTEYPFEQVAKFRSNTISPMLYIDVLHSIAKMYNDACLVVENNAEGKEVVDGLWYNLEYMNLFNEGKDIGFRTTKKSKSIGLTVLKEIIETQKLIINDFDTIDELSTFIMQTNHSYGAEKGKYDDTVMALLFFCYFLRSPAFKDFYQNHDLKKELYAKELTAMEDEFALPIMRVTDGVNMESSDNSSNLPKVLKSIYKKERIAIMRN